jgi:hypothetical protein
MSSRARKFAKRIELTQRKASGTKHGCEECRSVTFRQQITRELVEKGLVAAPPRLACPACSAIWLVRFGGDAAGQATVSFTVPVLS